jgi:hypothetical protein
MVRTLRNALLSGLQNGIGQSSLLLLIRTRKETE